MVEIHSKSRYCIAKPAKEKKGTARSRQSEKGAAAIANKQAARLKSFIKADNNRQLQQKITRQENGQAKTWVEIDGKMVAVSVADLNKVNKDRNEPIKKKKEQEYNKKYSLTTKKRKRKIKKR